MKELVAIHRSAPPHWVGDGFHVHSAFTYQDLGRELNPFVLLDRGAPREFSATSARRGVGPHPHRGFETVTIAFQGEIEHRDSSGGGGVIGAGDVQWMTAGAGVVHEEFHSRAFAARGGTLEMVQLWVNLPRAKKRTAPRYQSIVASTIPSAELDDHAGSVRVIAGEFGSVRGPAQTFTPIDLWVLTLHANAHTTLSLREGHVTALLVLDGELQFADGKRASSGELAQFTRKGSTIAVEAQHDSRVLVMSAEPIDEPLVGYGPFVMNTEGEIREAILDFQAGRMGALAPR